MDELSYKLTAINSSPHNELLTGWSSVYLILMPYILHIAVLLLQCLCQSAQSVESTVNSFMTHRLEEGIWCLQHDWSSVLFFLLSMVGSRRISFFFEKYFCCRTGNVQIIGLFSSLSPKTHARATRDLYDGKQYHFCTYTRC